MPLYSARIVPAFSATPLAEWEIEAPAHSDAIRICRNKAALLGIVLRRTGPYIRVFKVGGRRAPR